MGDVKVPQLPDNIKKGIVIVWHSNEGSFIDDGDDLVEIEVLGESIVITAPLAGTLTDIFFDVGEEVEAGEVIAEIEEE